MKVEALGVHVRRKYEKLDEYAHNLLGRLILYTTEEIHACSIGKGPTHLGANFLESPGAKEKWASININ